MIASIRLGTAALLLAALVGCEEKAPTDSTGLCEAICTSNLTFTFSDGRESFQLQVYGDGLNTTNVFCPDEIFAGGVESIACDPGAVTLTRIGAEFPELLRVSLDDGGVQDVFPTYEPVTLCETDCNLATVPLL